MSKPGAFLVSLVFLSTLMAACGSDDGDDEGLGSGAANGSGASGGSSPIDLGGSGGTTGIPGSHDGGTVPLTPEQITDIEDGACAGWSTEGENLPAVLELVVDVSGSMDRQAPGSNESKWTITREALGTAIDDLPASTAVGVLYYPNMDTSEGSQPRDVSECVNVDEMVPIDLLGATGSAQRDLIAMSLQDANAAGGTPTHDAYQYALENGITPFVSSASKFMLLITDGQPTFSLECVGTGMTSDPVNEQPIVDEIAGAFAAGIRTFVIGSPGSEENVSTGDDARPWLSRAATEGGTATPGCSDNGPNFCHFDMTQAADFSAALREGLGQIVGQINSCTYVIPPPPAGEQIDLSQVNLILSFGSGDSELILPDNTGDCSEGWQLNEEQQIVLCEATCNRVSMDMQARVELLFGCASGEVPIPK